MSPSQDHFRFREQYDLILDFFLLEEENSFLAGSPTEFAVRTAIMLAGAFSFRFLLDIFVPGIAEALIILAAIALAVLAVVSFLSSANRRIAEDGGGWLARHLALLAVAMVVASVL